MAYQAQGQISINNNYCICLLSIVWLTYHFICNSGTDLHKSQLSLFTLISFPNRNHNCGMENFYMVRGKHDEFCKFLKIEFSLCSSRKQCGVLSSHGWAYWDHPSRDSVGLLLHSLLQFFKLMTTWFTCMVKVNSAYKPSGPSINQSVAWSQWGYLELYSMQCFQ